MEQVLHSIFSHHTDKLTEGRWGEEWRGREDKRVGKEEKKDTKVSQVRWDMPSSSTQEEEEVSGSLSLKEDWAPGQVRAI